MRRRWCWWSMSKGNGRHAAASQLVEGHQQELSCIDCGIVVCRCTLKSGHGAERIVNVDRCDQVHNRRGAGTSYDAVDRGIEAAAHPVYTQRQWCTYTWYRFTSEVNEASAIVNSSRGLHCDGGTADEAGVSSDSSEFEFGKSIN